MAARLRRGLRHTNPPQPAAHAAPTGATARPGAPGPDAVLGLKTFVVDLLEGLKILVHQVPQIRGLRIARAVQGGRLDTRRRHDSNGRNPVVYL
jgi:hypothetical protein